MSYVSPNHAARYVESYQRDIQDRAIAVTNIENQVMTIDYALGDFINQITHFDQSAITNVYDSAGRLTQMAYSGGTTLDYSYYPDGELKTSADSLSSISNSYDRLNRLTNQIVQVGNLQSEIGNTFDSVGNITNTTIQTGWIPQVEGANFWIAASAVSQEAKRIYSFTPTTKSSPISMARVTSCAPMSGARHRQLAQLHRPIKLSFHSYIWFLIFYSSPLSAD